jgi:hypothetical protein
MPDPPAQSGRMCKSWRRRFASCSTAAPIVLRRRRRPDVYLSPPGLVVPGVVVVPLLLPPMPLGLVVLPGTPLPNVPGLVDPAPLDDDGGQLTELGAPTEPMVDEPPTELGAPTEPMLEELPTLDDGAPAGGQFTELPGTLEMPGLGVPTVEPGAAPGVAGDPIVPDGDEGDGPEGEAPVVLPGAPVICPKAADDSANSVATAIVFTLMLRPPCMRLKKCA